MPAIRRYESLRRGRYSVPGACYFVTACTHARRAGLTESAVATRLAAELNSLHQSGACEVRAWTIMPDHLHLFVRLTESLGLGQVVGRLKARTREQLALTGIRWQGNYFEHRLRGQDSAADVLRYLFLNPYRCGLASPSAPYAHFWISPADAAWFAPDLDDGNPVPAWLA